MFARKVKMFSSQEKTILDGEVRRIIANPSIGQEKRGTLRGIFVHKFKIHTNQFLPSNLKINMLPRQEMRFPGFDPESS